MPLTAATARSQGDLPEVVYTPESALRRPGPLVREVLRDLGKSRELAWRLFLRDIRAQYRQSLLGYLWLLMPPLASTLLFVFLQSQSILNVGPTELPYPAYVLIGVILWEILAASVNAPLATVGGAVSMLSKLNFPRESLLLSALYQVLFSLAIRLLLLAGVFVWYGLAVPATILLAPLAILTLVGFGFMLGLLLVPLGMLYQDIGRGLTMLLNVWFLVTPVIYPPPTAWPASLVTRLNPVSPLLITAREMSTTGHLTTLPAFLVVAGTTILLLFLGWLLYRLAMPHLIARMTA
jgi:lipopolysaccharide transport system permease protein